jgi:para-aminobenzoate synthetase
VPEDRLFQAMFGNKPYAFWLDSSEGFSFMGGYSADEAKFIRYSARERKLETPEGAVTADLFDYLKGRFTSDPPKDNSLPFDFTAGFIGYFGYELKELTGSPCVHASEDPDSYLLAVDSFVAIDHAAGEIYLMNLPDAALEQPPVPTHPDEAPTTYTPAIPQHTYLNLIDHCLNEIHDGNSYEICLTNKFKVSTSTDPFEYYRRLRTRNPAPYSAFLRFPELSIACSSPERFLKVFRDGRVESKPIKGTAARGRTRDEDDMLREKLALDEKARAENLMIVDLVRNDLSQVCEVGSVSVPQLMQVETYATLHQLVSTISGTLRKDQTAIDCLRKAFPGGSMTGAPKLRTMEIIDSLETEARGVYSGAIGYLSANGCADLNIVIRTAVFHEGRASIGTGGAIVAQSDPQAEWRELMLKAKALLDAFGSDKATQS